MIVTTIGIAILAAIGFWLIGGIVLRVGGVLIALVGAVGLVLNGNANGMLVFAIGVTLWLAGHWHFALRHHEYKSPLAERVFSWLPPRLDPTRGWAVPVVAEHEEQTTSTEDRKGAESPGTTSRPSN
jgi:hypothetical protein